MPDLQRRLSALGLIDADAASEAARNIVASPLADVDPGAILDVSPIVVALEAKIAADSSLRRLPAKFGFLIDGGGALPLGDVEADVRFEAFRGEDGARFAVALASDEDAMAVCTPREVPAVAASLAAAFLREAATRGDAPRRMRELTLAHGAAPILRAASLMPVPPRPSARRPAMHQDFLGTHPLALSALGWSEPSPQPLLGDREAIVRRERATGFRRAAKSLSPRRSQSDRPMREGGPDEVGSDEGSFWFRRIATCFGGPLFVGAAPVLGRMTADDFRFLAQAARRCSAADIRVTPWRALILAGLERQGAEDLAAALAQRFIVAPADPRLAVVACSGAPACAKAARPVQAEALGFASSLPSGEGIVLHVSGCEKGCAHPALPHSRSSRTRPAMTWWSTAAPATSPRALGCVRARSRLCSRVCKESPGRDDEPRLHPRRRGNLSPSFAIIRREADLARFEGPEERVAVRVIHACGMVEAAADLHFSPGAALRRSPRCGAARRSCAIRGWSPTG